MSEAQHENGLVMPATVGSPWTTILACLFAPAVAAAVSALPPNVFRGVPSVLLVLGSGILVRAALHSFVLDSVLAPLSRPILNLCLSLVGMLIGSHLNREILSTLGGKMVLYLAMVFTATFVAVTVTAMWLFPQHRSFAPFVGAIALERSSPEALAGISETGSSGPFASSTMLTAAMMDWVALVAFVLFSATMGGQQSAAEVLIPMTSWTVLATIVAVGWLRLANSRLGASTAIVSTGLVLTFLRGAVHFELLLSAIVVGAVLNFRAPHPTTVVLEEYSGVINVVLFSLSGLRIDLVQMAATFAPHAIVFLFGARLVGLWGGSAAGATFCSMPHPHWRCFGLVTQLAIALSLIHRLQEMAKDARPLADAAAGMVILNLCAGPPLLLLALRRTGSVAGGNGSGGKESLETSSRLPPPSAYKISTI